MGHLYFAFLSTCLQEWHNEPLNNIHITGQVCYWGTLTQLHCKYWFCVSGSFFCRLPGSHSLCLSKNRLYFSDQWGNCDGKQVFDLSGIKKREILKRFCWSEANSNSKWMFLTIKITYLGMKWTFCSVIPLNQKQLAFEKAQPKSMGLMNKLLSKAVQLPLSSVTNSDCSGLI